MPQPVRNEQVRTSGNLLVAVGDDRQHALVARQTRSADRGSFHAVVFRAAALPLVLVEAGLPLGNDRWEFRTSGLWVEAVCEQPGLHWSYGLEAFSLAIDRPDELAGRGYGHRTPLGWELDFLSDDRRREVPVCEPADPVEDGGDQRIEVGRVEGLLLTAPAEGGEMPFAGDAWRADWTLLSPDPWPVVLAAPAGPAVEVALPLDGVGAGGPLWLVGHDGATLTSRWSNPRG